MWFDYFILVVAAWLVLINLYGALLFCYDKVAAKKKKKRIPEARLHKLEWMGAVWFILPLLFLISHKSAKPAYYTHCILPLITWSVFLFFVGWLSNIL